MNVSVLREAYMYWRKRGARPAKALQEAREDYSTGRTRYYSASWRKTGGCWQDKDRMAKFSSPSDRAFFCDNWPDGIRLVGRTDEVAKHEYENGRGMDRDLRDCRGWYVDDFQNDTISGYVLQLPSRDGKPQYFGGLKQTDCDGVTLYLLDRDSDPLVVARRINRIAEREAETQREYQEQWRAGQDAAEHEEEIKAERKCIIAVCRDIRTLRRIVAAKGLNANEMVADAMQRLCALARGKVESGLDHLRELREKRDELKRDYGNTDGFKEGYGS